MKAHYTIQRLPYRISQLQRQRLLELGVEPWRVTACHDANLAALAQEAYDRRVRLVDDVDELSGDDVMELVPRLGASRLDPIDVRMRREGCTEDEIASVLTFVTGRLVEAPALGVLA